MTQPWMEQRAQVCRCGHMGRQHDPEDGDCEAGSYPPCECKRFEWVPIMVSGGSSLSDEAADAVTQIVAAAIRLRRKVAP